MSFFKLQDYSEYKKERRDSIINNLFKNLPIHTENYLISLFY